MKILQLVRCLKYEYTNGAPALYHINDMLKYYHRKYDKDEINNKKICLSQFRTNNGYSRMSLYNDHNFELAMLLWDKNSQSKIHTHDSNCTFMVLEGQIYEARYIKTDALHLKGTYEYNPSDVGNVLENEYHNMFNIDSDKSLTLHVYNNLDNFQTNFDLIMG